MIKKIIVFGSTGHLGVNLKQSLNRLENKIDIYYANRLDVDNILKDNFQEKFLGNNLIINLVSIVGNENILNNNEQDWINNKSTWDQQIVKAKMQKEEVLA